MRIKYMAALLTLVAPSVACGGGGAPAEAPVFLAMAHAHNDYVRGRPLLEAVERGFGSVEVDVVLLDGSLYVAHEASEVRRSDTLARLYLEPLRDLVSRNGGHVFAMSDSSLQLLVDAKSAPDETYRALQQELSAYPDVFTRWTKDGAERGPVTAILTGNRPIESIRTDTLRYLALDGRIDEERVPFSVEVMPLVSIDWAMVEAFDPAERLAKAREWIDTVHGEGRRIRFWGTPDRAPIWNSLIEMGADLIGADDIGRLERTLRAR